MASCLAPLASAAGSGAIYRCVTDNDTVHYQQLPCAGQQAGELQGAEANNARALQDWLTQLRATLPSPSKPSPATRDRQPQREQSLPLGLPSRPPGQLALAQCSALFLDCANGSDTRMDNCVAQLPRCDSQSQRCCHRAFLNRYQLLRRAGFDRKLATRDALLAD